MQDESDPRSESIPCPICGLPLKRTAERWVAALECDRCGQFSDFRDVSPTQNRRSAEHSPFGRNSLD